jgi:hypothetical protein
VQAAENEADADADRSVKVEHKEGSTKTKVVKAVHYSHKKVAVHKIHHINGVARLHYCMNK